VRMSGGEITTAESMTRYAINTAGIAADVIFPVRGLSFDVKYFDEFADRSTFPRVLIAILGLS
jgi:hypothetical protein